MARSMAALAVSFSLSISASLAFAESPLTPVIGVNPSSLDFGCVSVGSCEDLTAQLSNTVSDPASHLTVTGITVAGSGFSLADGPTLPISIPGDGTTVPLLVRFCPTVEGAASGTLTVTAPNAANSPLVVPLAGSTCAGGALSTQFTIRFSPRAITPPPNPDGPLAIFRFNVPGLRAALEAAGVESLRKILPWFTPESVHTRNALGEDVVLDDLSTLYTARVAVGRNALDAVYALRERPGLRYAEADHIFHTNFIPDDELFSRNQNRGGQWGLHNTGQFSGAVTDVDINAPEAWDRFTGSPFAWVAVLDTGVDSAHVDLAPWVRNGPNYVTAGPPADDDVALSHGTACAGIIGAIGNNDGEGVAGVGWGTTIAAVKAFDGATGTGDPDDILAGIDWARSTGVPIVNMSFGSPMWHQGIYEVTRNAALAGTFLVGAMGNDNEGQPNYPAAHAYTVFSIGALFWNGDRWDDSTIPCPGGRGSSFGNWIDVCAPGGRGIVTTRRLDDYYDMDPGNLCPAFPQIPDGFGGTSAAAPFVSGLAALLRSYHQNLISDDLAEVMKRTARDVEQYGLGWDQYTGHGLIRADAALDYVSYPRVVEQRQLVPSDVEQFSINMQFNNVPGLGNGTYPSIRHRMRATHSFETDYLQTPSNWYRTSGTRGWPAPNPFDYNTTPPSWANVTNVSSSSITLETFVFEVWDVGGHFRGWFPCEPGEARIAFTAIGAASPVAVDDQTILRPVRLSVAPNPGFGRTEFFLDLPRGGRVALRVYDPTGRLVRTLSDRSLPSGNHTLPWDGRNDSGHTVSRGVYFWELGVNGERVGADKVLIVR